MIRVVIHSLNGDPMLYRLFRHRIMAQEWADWATATLPCIVEIGDVD